MPTRQLPSGKHQARRWNAERGKYESLGTFRTREEAEKAEQKAELLTELGLIPETSASTPPAVGGARGREKFAKYAERKLNLKKHQIQRSTFHQYSFVLQAHLVPTFGNMAVADIQVADVEQWWSAMDDNPHARRAAYGFLVQVMRKAEREGLIRRSPCLIEHASADPSAKRPTFTVGDFWMLHDLASDDQMRAILWVMVGTGVRTGEALGLNWEDVDFVGGTIGVNKHFSPYGMVEGTKSHKDGARTLAMPEQATAALLALYQSRQAIPTDAVFLNSRGGRLSYHKFNVRFVDLKKACGLDQLHAHDLRHVHLSAFAKSGATLAELMARGGHTDHRSSLRYQHVDPQRQRELVAQMTF